MCNEPQSQTTTATVSWRTCPRCGALVPDFECAKLRHQTNPKCCGLIPLGPTPLRFVLHHYAAPGVIDPDDFCER